MTQGFHPDTIVAVNTDTRIAALRERLTEQKDSVAISHLKNNPVVDANSLRASEGMPSWTLRRGMLTRDRLRSMRFTATDIDILAGRLDTTALPRPDEVSQSREYIDQYRIDLPGQTGHCELDLSEIMAKGIDGLIESIRAEPANAQQQETLDAFVYALEGLSEMIENASIDAPQEIALCCSRVAHDPPSTFQDAIQLLWLINLAVMHADRASLVGPGHVDRVLIPYFERDIADGSLTKERALNLIEALYLHINEYVDDGLAIALMIGGRDESGTDVTNPLSFLCLDALKRTRCIYPSVGICWHEGTPKELVDAAVKLMGRGYPNPAFFGDETIQQGLINLGVPQREACSYINSTCVEITPCGSSNVWVASPYYNTCGLLLEEMTSQKSDAATTFEAFFASYKDRLHSAVAEGVATQNSLRANRMEYCRRPLQSVFTRDCVERRLDIEQGGALYNWVECSFIGLANLADSLYVIRQEVFEHHNVTLAEMHDILKNDFKDNENIRQRWLNGYAKYGQDRAEVDSFMNQIVEHVTGVCGRFTVVPDNSSYVPGAFAWIQHERLGRETGATPDGRHAGFPFADGCGPAQGRETLGPTAALLSVTSWPHSDMIGGLAYNLKFNRGLFESTAGFDSLKNLLLTYLRRGGFEAQVNSIDTAVLREARDNPEEYRDLVVRIGGYCDYFTRLSPEMQEELIQRTEFQNF